MKTENTHVSRIVKDISTLVTLEDGKEFTMCGEIVNNDIDIDSVGVVYYESSEFSKLDEELCNQIKQAAFIEFRRFC